jgi:hypothetical protein
MDNDKVLAQIYHHLETGDVEKAVTACLRISRSIKDYLNTAGFLRELFTNKQEFMRALYEDVSHLKEDAQKYLYETSLNRWLEIHTLDFSLSREEPDRNVPRITSGELDPELE